MLRVRVVWGQIRGATAENREAALRDIAPTVILGAVPLLLTILILILINRISAHELGAILFDGELLMLTNAVVAAAAMLIGKERRNRPRFPGGDLFILIGLLLILASTTCFTAIKLCDLLQYKGINDYALGIVISAIFIAGVFYAYYVVLLDGIVMVSGINPEGEVDAATEAIAARLANRRRDLEQGQE